MRLQLMAPIHAQPARGMRDFLPDDVRRREYVIGVVADVYERYGFEPLETPAFENIETLLGKYGEEGNQLIFKILKRGEHEQTGRGRPRAALRPDRAAGARRRPVPDELPRVLQALPDSAGVARRPAGSAAASASSTSATSTPSDRRRRSSRPSCCAAVSEVLERLGFSDFAIRLNHREVLRGLLDARRRAGGAARHGARRARQARQDRRATA